MGDLISRSAVLEVLKKYSWCDLTDYLERGKVESALNKLPVVDAVPVVHARWDEDGECTRCGCTAEYTEYATERYDYDWDENLVPCGIEYSRIYHTTDYCPTCGAKMDAE